MIFNGIIIILKYSKTHHFWETSQSHPHRNPPSPFPSRPSGRKAAPLGIGGSTGNDALRQVLAGNTEDLPLSDGKGATTTPAARGWLMRGVLPCFFWERCEEILGKYGKNHGYILFTPKKKMDLDFGWIWRKRI